MPAPRPDAPAPAGPHLIRATDLPYPVTGPQPEEQPFVPVRRFERRAERSHDVPYPAGPRRRNVAPPSPAGGTAVATRPVATAVTSIAAAPAAPRPTEEPPRRPEPEPEPPVRGPYGTTRIPTGELVGGLAADAARAAAAAAATALVRAPEARRAMGRALRQARRRNGPG